MVQRYKDMVNNMKSTVFWEALGTGAAAPAMLYSPRKDYMIYANFRPVLTTNVCKIKSVNTRSKSNKTIKVIRHEHAR